MDRLVELFLLDSVPPLDSTLVPAVLLCIHPGRVRARCRFSLVWSFLLLTIRVMLMLMLLAMQVHVVDHHIEQSSDMNATSVVIEQVRTHRSTKVKV